MPRQVVDNLQNCGPFTVVRVVRMAEGTRSASIGLIQPSPNRTTVGIWFLVLDMHLLIRAIRTKRLGPQGDIENRSTRRTQLGPPLPPKIVAMMRIMIVEKKIKGSKIQEIFVAKLMVCVFLLVWKLVQAKALVLKLRKRTSSWLHIFHPHHNSSYI